MIVANSITVSRLKQIQYCLGGGIPVQVNPFHTSQDTPEKRIISLQSDDARNKQARARVRESRLEPKKKLKSTGKTGLVDAESDLEANARETARNLGEGRETGQKLEERERNEGEEIEGE